MMNITDFKKKFDDIIKPLKFEEGVVGTVSYKKISFAGVYVLYDKKDSEKVIYVGSAYAPERTIASRFREYRTNSSGNSLKKVIMKYKNLTDEKEALAYIKGLSFIAYAWFDLEYHFIKNIDSLINERGKTPPHADEN